jgi:ABC-type amino acid transport system permease subunit
MNRPKAKRVVTTLTDYRKDPEKDTMMLETLKRHYPSVELWLQGTGDLAYFKSLKVSGVATIAPSLGAFDASLTSDSTDFIGTRLHAGIRAMQKGQRALIVSVDNRATEMGRDFQLPVLSRTAMKTLDEYIETAPATKITLPIESITAWRNQFHSAVGRS